MRNHAIRLLLISIQLSLFLAALTGSLFLVFGNQNSVKRSFVKNGAYDKFNTAYIENLKEQAGITPTDNGTVMAAMVNDPRFQAIIQKSFTPEFLQRNTEQTIDAVYAWLHNDSSRPAIRIDLSKPKATYIAGMADYAADRSEKLPVCTQQELKNYQGSFNPYVAACRPLNVSPDQIRKDVERQYQQNNGIVDQPVLTTDSLSKGRAAVVFGQLERIKTGFKIMAVLPFLLCGLIIVIVVDLFLLHSSKRKAFLTLGWGFIGVAVFILMNSLLLYSFSSRSIDDIITTNGTAVNRFSALSGSIVRTLGGEVNEKLLVFSGVYLAIGGALIVTYLALRRTTAHQVNT